MGVFGENRSGYARLARYDIRVIVCRRGTVGLASELQRACARSASAGGGARWYVYCRGGRRGALVRVLQRRTAGRAGTCIAEADGGPEGSAGG
jgi:hypothetical protein